MSKNSFSLSKTTIALLVSIAATLIAFRSGLEEIVRRWTVEPEYGHGPLLLLLAIFFIYQKRAQINNSPAGANGVGLLVIVFSILLYIAGEVSSLYILIHYAFVGTIYGFFVCLFGLNVTRHIAPSLLLLIFAIPIPYFLQTELTINLQLLSSWLGVQIIRLFSIPVFLEGNVIDLGIIKLQVVEACAGLRYLFSLLSFGFICAYIYHVEMWKRLIVFFSTIPITIVMNSVRIAMVAVLVNRHGPEMADGVTHNFQGIVVFSICLVLLFLEMWLLTKVGKIKTSLRHVFGFDFENHNDLPTSGIKRQLSKTFAAALVLVASAFIVIHSLEQRKENIPERDLLIRFPTQLGSWQGSSTKLDSDVLSKLKLSDYISADYRQQDNAIPVNFYVAYYESQRKGVSPHSPRVCIPGGGWEITQLDRQYATLASNKQTLFFNRAIIKKGSSTQLVYYWFQQRGLSISNEYLMKWYLLRDALVKNRSDGALVRLVTPILANEEADAADKRLLAFANESAVLLTKFIPN